MELTAAGGDKSEIPEAKPGGEPLDEQQTGRGNVKNTELRS